MCVTNTTHRRIQAVTLNPSELQVSPSALSQRLLGNFTLSQIPSVPSSCAALAAVSVPSLSTVSTCASRTATSPSSGASASLSDGVQPYYGSFPSQEEVALGGKPRPKRRRKPQKPGKTAKLNDRHFVVHNYHDHSNDGPDDHPYDSDDHQHHQDQYYYHDDHQHHHHPYSEEGRFAGRGRGGTNVPFPIKLHAVLEQVERDGYAHVVSWSPHGRCFVIHKPKQFTEEVMPKYFKQSKLTSFQRQLNLYGFARLTRGPDAGGYYHELFLRNREHLCKRMTRTKVKGTRFKAASSPESEPDFYSMPPVVGALVSPHPTSDEEMSHDSSRYSQSTAPMPPAALPSPLASLSAVLPSLFVSFPNAAAAAASAFPPAPAQSSQYAQQPPPAASMMGRCSSDQALDAAVDELLLGELGDQEDLLSDISSWCDPAAYGDQGAGVSSIDMEDVQLGFMLEKLLEDV